MLAAEEADGVTKAAEIKARRAAQNEVRQGVLGKIRPDLLRKYNIIRDRKGPAVAEISGGICRGCNISIPPQMVAKLHDGRDLHQCPNCQRILLFKPTGSGV